jgi:hypothetical protein
VQVLVQVLRDKIETEIEVIDAADATGGPCSRRCTGESRRESRREIMRERR